MTQPQQNVEPKKSWFARHKILTGLGVLIILVVVFNLATGGKDPSPDTSAVQTSSAADAPAASAPAPAEPGIGASVRDGKFEFVVQNIQPGVMSVGGEYTSQTPQGEYILVTLSVANIGDRQQLFDITSQKLLDAAGRQFSADTVATITNDPNISLTQINPGNSVVATLVFDVPAGTSPAEIELHDSLFSGGATISLR
ncbi:DUF4352 domain-containing protein [Actinomycetes bacterium M1A6_2h]